MEALNPTILFAAGTAVGVVGAAVAVYITKRLVSPKQSTATTRGLMTLDQLFEFCDLIEIPEPKMNKRKAALQLKVETKRVFPRASITNAVQPSKVYLIRVCGGGHFGAQSFSLTAALRFFQKKNPGLSIKIETMHPKDRREFGSISEIINWLLSSDFHIISTHLHQGHSQDWDIRILMKEISRLTDHPGFPTGYNLECPVFLQDKMKYLNAVKTRTLETLKVPLSALQVGRYCPDAIKNEDEVRKFMDRYYENRGWIIKMGYMTNSGGRIFCESKADVIRLLRLTSERYGAWFPYAMVQPTLSNRMECKVVVLDGKAQYITMEKKKKGRTFATEKELMQFAEESVVHLLRACPASLGRFLIRVDIMQRGDGRMIVNEFESFEAFFTGRAENESRTYTWLTQFWINVIEQGFK